MPIEEDGVGGFFSPPPPPPLESPPRDNFRSLYGLPSCFAGLRLLLVGDDDLIVLTTCWAPLAPATIAEVVAFSPFLIASSINAVTISS